MPTARGGVWRLQHWARTAGSRSRCRLLTATRIYYYYFDVSWPSSDGTTSIYRPAPGEAAPFVYFVSQDHLGDLDRHDDLLDIFDLVRLARRDAWGEPLPVESAVIRAGITSVPAAVTTLLRAASDEGITAEPIQVEHDDRAVRIEIGGDSSVTIPRIWNQRITDLVISGMHAEVLMHAHAALAAFGRGQPTISRSDALCGVVDEIAINDVFYREQPHAMRRYSALALDNIRREPVAFVTAALYRAFRVFVVIGTSDIWTTQQFSGSRIVYSAATIVTLSFLALCAAGMIIAWRSHDSIGLPLLLILYVPATIAPLLTNMRYSVTVQPLMFVFVAVTLRTLARRSIFGSFRTTYDKYRAIY